MSQTSLYALYRLTKLKKQPVELSIKVGYAQNSVTDIRIDNNKIQGDGPDGDFTGEDFTVPLGKTGQLTGRKLLINTIVHDINPNSDMTSVEIHLTGGLADYTHTMSASVDPATKTILYTYYIHFYN